MKKVAIGCGILLLLFVVALVGIVALGYAIVRSPQFQAALNPSGGSGKQLFGVLQLVDVEVQPGSPTTEDTVSFRVNASYGGTLAPETNELEVQILVRSMDDERVQVSTAVLKTKDENAGDELHGSAMIRWGELSKGRHKFIISILPPPQGLFGAIHAAKEVQLEVKEAESP